MADPFSLGAVGLASTVLGGATSAAGAIMKGNADSRMYSYKAGMAQTNAAILSSNADYTRTQGDKQAMYSGISGGQKMGSIRAKQSANGLDINSGSNSQVQEGQQWATQEDEKNITDTSTRKAYGYDVESSSKRQEAELDLQAGSNAKSAGYISAAGSILGTASSVATKWSQGSTAGLWGNDPNQGITTYGPDFNVTGYRST